jgi:hypothetical protein
MTLSNVQWRTLFAVVAAVCSFLLASDLHPQVILPPVVQLVLGAVLVALAAIRAPEDAPPIPSS